uniref:Putative salivary secreted protein n=1 Tax=Ixodes ricinus TaxID=34613 RepID=A0A6B0UEE9_IXORI
MLLVLFVVVLILPVFEAAANYFYPDPDFVCLKIIKKVGDLFCKFQGHNICTEDAKEKLNKWKDELEKRKESLSKEWCSNCKGK